MAVAMLVWAWQQKNLDKLALIEEPSHPPIFETFRSFADFAGTFAQSNMLDLYFDAFRVREGAL